MKTCCVYHSVDLDGWMSAAIVKHWFNLENNGFNTIPDNNSIDFIGYNYGDPIPDLTDYDRIIMCDISFPALNMHFHKTKLRADFVWIDHHISAINEMGYTNNRDSTYCAGLRDTAYAACELTWKYFFPNDSMPEIIRLLGRYDCFGHKNTNEEQKVLEFQYGARKWITNYEEAYDALKVNLGLEGLVNRKVDAIQTTGEIVYDYLCTEAKQTYKNGFEIRLFTYTDEEHMNPHKFICINKERFNPINFGIDYHKDGYDGCACFHYANGMWNFSLYNDNGQVDCSVIAKQFGGGGHKGAAGFRIKDINDIIK